MMLPLLPASPGAKVVATFAERQGIMIDERCADFVKAALAV